MVSGRKQNLLPSPRSEAPKPIPEPHPVLRKLAHQQAGPWQRLHLKERDQRGIVTALYILDPTRACRS